MKLASRTKAAVVAMLDRHRTIFGILGGLCIYFSLDGATHIASWDLTGKFAPDSTISPYRIAETLVATILAMVVMLVMGFWTPRPPASQE